MAGVAKLPARSGASCSRFSRPGRPQDLIRRPASSFSAAMLRNPPLKPHSQAQNRQLVATIKLPQFPYATRNLAPLVYNERKWGFNLRIRSTCPRVSADVGFEV